MTRVAQEQEQAALRLARGGKSRLPLQPYAASLRLLPTYSLREHLQQAIPVEASRRLHTIQMTFANW